MIKKKFDNIIKWYSSKSKNKVRDLDTKTDSKLIEPIEKLIGEKFPEELTKLYKSYNGEKGNGIGTFLGHTFVTLDEILNSLSFSKTLIIPSNPAVTNPNESDRIIKSIIEAYKKNIPAEYTTWYKIKFECSPGSQGGPYIYASKETSDIEKKVFELDSDSSSLVYKFAKELHKLEEADYNWNVLEVCTYSNGEFTANRTFFNFDEELPLTSLPENAI